MLCICMARSLIEHGVAWGINVKISVKFLAKLWAKNDEQQLFSRLQSGDLGLGLGLGLVPPPNRRQNQPILHHGNGR